MDFPSLTDLGWLFGANGSTQPDDRDSLIKAASAKLAAQMRQQSPDVPPPDQSGDTFASRFGALDAAPPLSNVPLPQPRPPQADVGAAPPAAQSAAPPALYNSASPPLAPANAPRPSAALPAAPSFLDRLSKYSGDNSATLLALGAGFAGAPSIGTGMSRAFANAAPFAQQNQTVAALVKAGLSPDQAQLVASNPAALQQVLPRVLGSKQWQLGEKSGAFGDKQPFLYDPVSGETKMLDFSPKSQPQTTAGTLVRQNGHLYQRQPDGSYQAVQ